MFCTLQADVPSTSSATLPLASSELVLQPLEDDASDGTENKRRRIETLFQCRLSSSTSGFTVNVQ